MTTTIDDFYAINNPELLQRAVEALIFATDESFCAGIRLLFWDELLKKFTGDSARFK